MKRICLIILSSLFLILWVVGFFYANKTGSIHIALIVGLPFFMLSLMKIEQPVAKETQDEAAVKQPLKETASL
jgi:hypothetical protein